MDNARQEIVDLTARLLDSIASGDWEIYAGLCAADLTAFEPEACGHRIEGLEFHRFYFDNLSHRHAVNTTLCQPHVRFAGPDAAVIAYVRLQQKMSGDGVPVTTRHEETRVWQRVNGRWLHVHFHRSAGPA